MGWNGMVRLDSNARFEHLLTPKPDGSHESLILHGGGYTALAGVE